MIELFHATNDDGASAQARQAVVDLDVVEQVRFRNVFYAEVLADLQSHGGASTPALWDGTRLIEGVDDVLAALRALPRP
jgi:hypothetical protein